MKKQETKLEIKTACHQDTPIFNVLLDMKKNGLANDTIRNVDKALSALSKRCDLNKPEQAKKLIENGYEYITEMDEQKLFRKRK